MVNYLGEENSTDKTVKAMLPRSEKLEAILPRSFTTGCCVRTFSFKFIQKKGKCCFLWAFSEHQDDYCANYSNEDK